MLTYLMFILIVAAVYALLSQSLVLSFGTTGMVNLGLVGFFAVGAYVQAILTRDFHVPVAVGFLISFGAGGLIGLLVTFSTLRLRDDFLAIVTLGFAELVRTVAANEVWLTGGTQGISSIPSLFDRTQGVEFYVKYLLVITLLCIVVGLVLNFATISPWGRVLKAIRDDQTVAGVAGKSVVSFKAQSFSLSTAISALAGAIYASFITFISPDLFLPLITIYVFLAATAGGSTRIIGGIVGAYILVSWLEISRFLTDVLPMITSVQTAALREIAVGVALILVLKFAPGGLFKQKNQKAPQAPKSKDVAIVRHQEAI